MSESEDGYEDEFEDEDEEADGDDKATDSDAASPRGYPDRASSNGNESLAYSSPRTSATSSGQSPIPARGGSGKTTPSATSLSPCGTPRDPGDGGHSQIPAPSTDVPSSGNHAKRSASSPVSSRIHGAGGDLPSPVQAHTPVPAVPAVPAKSWAAPFVSPRSAQVLELMGLINSSSACASGANVGHPGVNNCSEIWTRVAEGGESLPGDWDATIAGVLDAARQGEVGTCAYLAAKCFADAGGSANGVVALSAVDVRAQDALWQMAVDPVVVEVPLGQERLWVEDIDGKAEWVPTSHIVLDRSRLDEGAVGGLPVRIRGRGEGILPRSLYDSAECFHAGATVDLSQAQWSRRRLRRLVLNNQQRLQLRTLVTGRASGQLPEFLRPDQRGAQYVYVPGGRFHVLAYPLGGDLTRALLRPSERSWPDGRRKAIFDILAGLGETVVSQCAKSGLWELVATFLRAGLPVPSLFHEFTDLCGVHPAARRRWARDLAMSFHTNSNSSAMVGVSGTSYSATGFTNWSIGFSPQNRPALLDLAATGPRGSVAALREVIAALKQQGNLPAMDVPRGDGRPSILVEFADAGRWDLFAAVVEETASEGVASVVPFASSALLASAPQEVQHVIQSRTHDERLNGRKARSLQEYFERLLKGELMTTDSVPPDCTLADTDGISLLELSTPGDNPNFDDPGTRTPRVFSRGLWLGGVPNGSGGQIAFVNVSYEELLAVSAQIESGAAVLSLDVCWAVSPGVLQQRQRRMAVPCLGKPRHTSAAALATVGLTPDPCGNAPLSSRGIWLAVLCPAGCFRRNDAGADPGEGGSSRPSSAVETQRMRSSDAFLRIPRNCVPILYVQRTTVRVCTVTPCCSKPVKDVLVHFNGRRGGVTGPDGTLRLELPPGQYVFTAPEQSSAQTPHVDVDLGALGGELEVRLPVDGASTLYALRQDMSELGVPDEDWIYLCVNSHHRPVEAHDFVGSAEHVEIQPGIRCNDAFQRLTVNPTLQAGVRYVPNDEYAEWIEHLADECIVEALYNGTPIRIGKIISDTPSPASDEFAQAPNCSEPVDVTSDSQHLCREDVWHSGDHTRINADTPPATRLREAYLPAPGCVRGQSAVPAGGRRTTSSFKRLPWRQPHAGGGRCNSALQHQWLPSSRSGLRRRLQHIEKNTSLAKKLERPRSTPALRLSV